MNFTIIQLGIIHTNICLDLDQKSLKGLWTKSQWEKELTDPKRVCIGLIELETKKLLGICSAWLLIDELYITSIAVHPTHQRKGLGKLPATVVVVVLWLDFGQRDTSFLS